MYNQLHTGLLKYHNRFERFQGLFDIFADLPHDDFWRLFRDVLQETFVLFPHQELIRRMLSSERINSTGRLAAFEDADREWAKRAIRRHVGTVKVYRGAAEKNMMGFAWTTNKRLALEYAMKGSFQPGVLVVGRVKPSKIIIPMINDDTIFVFPEDVDVEKVDQVDSIYHPEELGNHRMKTLVAAYGAHYVMEMTPPEYLIDAIKAGRTTHDEVYGHLDSARKFLTPFGFTSRVSAIEESIAALKEYDDGLRSAQ